MEDLHKSGQVSSRFSDFKGGVNLGLGTFNLVSTLTTFGIIPVTACRSVIGQLHYNRNKTLMFTTSTNI